MWMHCSRKYQYLTGSLIHVREHHQRSGAWNREAGCTGNNDYAGVQREYTSVIRIIHMWRNGSASRLHRGGWGFKSLRVYQTMHSSMDRATVFGTVGWGFKSLCVDHRGRMRPHISCLWGRAARRRSATPLKWVRFPPGTPIGVWCNWQHDCLPSSHSRFKSEYPDHFLGALVYWLRHWTFNPDKRVQFSYALPSICQSTNEAYTGNETAHANRPYYRNTIPTSRSAA